MARQAASQCGQFEKEFAAYQDAKHGLAIVNGTVAVELALRAAGVQPGDEVIVPALSFVVSASAVLPLGAVPIFADADPLTADNALFAAIPVWDRIPVLLVSGDPSDEPSAERPTTLRLRCSPSRRAASDFRI